MAKNRVLFALWLLLWLSIWLWGSGNAAGFLLLASLLAAALEISLSLLVRRRITASLSAPVSCRKGEDLTVELRASNACFFSCAGLRAVLRCRNLLTGETEDAVLRLSVGGRGSQQLQHTCLTCSVSGVRRCLWTAVPPRWSCPPSTRWS